MVRLTTASGDLMTNKTWRRLGYGAIGVSAILAIAATIVFQDGIVRFFAAPRAPFQTTPPPAAPDYADAGAWLLHPDDTESAARPVDVFYVHSTTYYRRIGWNAPIDDPDADKVRRMVAAPNEAGPFSTIGAVYAPLYREATLYSLFTHKYDGIAARRLAYEDVKSAFDAFLADRDRERPILLVGYGQGGLYVLGLLNDYFQGEINPLRRRLVAAYVIGASTPLEFLEGLTPAMPTCASATAVRCAVSYVDYEKRFDEEMERIRNRTLAFNAAGDIVSIKSDRPLCVNPLSWTIDAEYRAPENNIGAASATGIAPGAPPAAMPKAVGARCEDGILIVDDPKRRFLRRGDWFGAKWKAQPFNIFYYDLSKNAEARVKALVEILEVEPEPLEPIGETIDLDASPVNKVPD